MAKPFTPQNKLRHSPPTITKAFQLQAARKVQEENTQTESPNSKRQHSPEGDEKARKFIVLDASKDDNGKTSNSDHLLFANTPLSDGEAETVPEPECVTTIIPEEGSNGGKDRLIETLSNLVRLCEKHRNTQGDIKDMIITAQKIALDIFTKQSTDSSTQTTDPKDHRRLQWQEQINSCKNTQDRSILCLEKWPQEAFQRTSCNIDKINVIGTTCLLVAKKGQIMSDSCSALRKQIPALDRIDHQNAQKISTICSTEVIDGSTQTDSKVFLLTLTEDDTENILGAMEEFRLKLGVTETNLQTVILSEEHNTIRKAMELVFADTEVSFSIVSRRRPESKTKPVFESLVVNPGAMSYADMVRSVRTNIDNEELGVRVVSVKKTEEGELELKVKGKISALQNRINEKVPEVTTRHVKRTIVLHIRDLEEEVTKAEIEEGIKKALPLGGCENVNTTSIRPAYGNTCNATIKLPEDMAKLIHKKGFVQIGLVSARVRIREETVKCFKCRNTGHTQKECTGEDMRDVCFTCRKKGHKRANCPNRQQLRQHTKYD